MTATSTNKYIRWTGILTICAAVLLLPATVNAHRMRPTIVTITFHPDQTYDATIKLNMEAVLAGIGPQHEDTDDSPNALNYNELRELPPDGLRARIDAFTSVLLNGINITFDDVRSRPALIAAEIPDVGDTTVQRLTLIRLAGQTPANAQQLVWAYAENFGSSAVRVGRAGETVMQSAFLGPGKASEPFPIGQPLEPDSTAQIAADYIGLGFTHIVPKGMDHILFVLGIFLLSVAWRPLLYQVTAFTIAHTITLGLSLYGIISLPVGIVEPLIAASIVYVGIENILTPQLKPWRVFIVFGFGLLHGMGFAGVLTEIGLPQDELLNALISFNIGVELGQLTVIGTAYMIIGHWFKNRPWYRQAVIIPCSAAIALIGAYWVIERIIS
jgi:hydrogenase/urease accessory protein HupE